MEALVLSGLISFALPKIWEVIQVNHTLRHELGSDIDYFRMKLPVIASAIEKLQSGSADTPTESMENLRELAHEVEDWLDNFRIHQLIRKRQHAWQFRLRGSRSTQFARELQRLRKRAMVALEDLDLSALSSSSLSPTSEIEPDEGLDTRPEEDIVGMREPLDHLMGMLQPSVGQTEELKVISIVGPGGVGKTLLASRVYQSVQQFSPLAFVRAANKSVEEVLRTILREIGVQSDTATSHKHELRQLLQSKLKGQRYLIVIDDLREKNQWELLKSAFPKEPVRSRVIVTTTIQSVADGCSIPNGCVYKMSTLGESDSRKLFMKAAGSNVMEPVLDTIFRKCDGLPLALLSIAKLLQNNGSLDIDIGSHLEGEELERMRTVLARNYSSLAGPVLKACLLYFCLFNCDNSIRRNSLTRRWLAEGFLDKNETDNHSNLLSAKYKNLSTLIDRNIIKPTDLSKNGKVKSCKPSGMMLEYISHKSMAEKFIASPYRTHQLKYIRRVCLRHSRQARKFDKSRLWTLSVSGAAGKDVLSFANSKLLRVLDLGQCHDVEDHHIRTICDLLLLKYLSLGPNITELPRKIAELQLLETLDLRETNIEAVPLEVIKLPQLRHLLGTFELCKGDYNRKYEKTGSKLMEFLSGSCQLETLAGFVASENPGFPQLMRHMMRLRKVKIWCRFDEVRSQTNMYDLSEAIKKFIRNGPATPCTDGPALSIDFEQCSHEFLNSNLFQDFVDSLSGARGVLGSLKLCGPGDCLSRILTFVTNVDGITELCLSSTTLVWDAVVNGLSTLRVLYFLKLTAKNMEGVVILPDQIKSLRRMRLEVTENLPQITIQDGALEFLVSLHLSCPDPDVLSTDQVTLLRNIKEFVLCSPGLTDEKRNNWKEAARAHPKRPNVLFI